MILDCPQFRKLDELTAAELEDRLHAANARYYADHFQVDHAFMARVAARREPTRDDIVLSALAVELGQ